MSIKLSQSQFSHTLWYKGLRELISSQAIAITNCNASLSKPISFFTENKKCLLVFFKYQINELFKNSNLL